MKSPDHCRLWTCRIWIHHQRMDTIWTYSHFQPLNAMIHVNQAPKYLYMEICCNNKPKKLKKCLKLKISRTFNSRQLRKWCCLNNIRKLRKMHRVRGILKTRSHCRLLNRFQRTSFKNNVMVLNLNNNITFSHWGNVNIKIFNTTDNSISSL